MSTSDDAQDSVDSSRTGRHAVETPKKFWGRVIATGSLRSLQGVGGALAVATAGAVAASMVGGFWYLAVGDLLGDRGTAATTAIAGSIAIWAFIAFAGVRATMGRTRERDRGRRRHRGGT